MKLINLTGGHSISFFTEEQCSLDERTKKLVLKEGEQPYTILPCEGCVRAARASTVVKVGELEDHCINFNKVEYGEPSGLPEALEEDTIYIVSFLALSAIRAHKGKEYASHFAIIDGMVTGPDGKPAGCTALSVGQGFTHPTLTQAKPELQREDT